jgi:MoxR-like ATPase
MHGTTPDRELPVTTPIVDSSTHLAHLVEAITKVYRGNRQAVELLVTTWLAGGHVLLEDIPGVGKTTLARALAAAVGGCFRRLQCTPDLMPADVTGVSIYDERERRFVFHPGPLFSEVLLADELNRTPPRTQSALLEALSEGQVTIDGEAKPLPAAFFCVATQNPLDHAGTFPLPDSQRDRFLLSFRLGYPESDEELHLLGSDGAEGDLAQVTPQFNAETILRLRAETRAVTVSEDVRRYLLAIIQGTRRHKAVQLGASPRAGIGLQRAAQAKAMLAGRRFVIPEDIQGLATVCLAHRLSMRPGMQAAAAIQAVVDTVSVPR